MRILGIRPLPATGVGARDCSALGGDGPREVDLPAGGAVLSAEGRAQVELRRFADSPQGSYSVGPDPVALQIPADSLAQPWVVSLADGDGSVEVCAP